MSRQRFHELVVGSEHDGRAWCDPPDPGHGASEESLDPLVPENSPCRINGARIISARGNVATALHLQPRLYHILQRDTRQP